MAQNYKAFRKKNCGSFRNTGCIFKFSNILVQKNWEGVQNPPLITRLLLQTNKEREKQRLDIKSNCQIIFILLLQNLQQAESRKAQKMRFMDR